MTIPTAFGFDPNPPTLETHRGAARFTNKPYFPAYVSNGIDSVLIDMHGSGNATWDEYDFAAASTQLMAKGWYKPTWRNRTDTKLPYGRLVPIVEFASRVMLNGDFAAPTDVRQYLHPRRGVVRTLLTFIDAQTNEPLRLRIETFMMRRSLLVEHLYVMDAPASGTVLCSRLNTPSEGYLEMSRRPDPVAGQRIDDRDAPAHLRLNWQEQSAVACSWLDRGEWSRHESAADGEGGVWLNQFSPTLNRGDHVSRFVAVLDGDNASASLGRWVTATRNMPYPAIRRHHRRHVAKPKIQRLARVQLGDPSLDFLYDTSRYFLDAIQHPSGYTPVGGLPYLWQGSMFWDASFAVDAWLSGSDHQRARRLASHLLSRMPEARALAKKLARPGARIEWTLGLTQPDPYDPPTLQVHNQAVWARTLLRVAAQTDDATSDTPLMPEAIVAAQELLECLASYIFIDGPDAGALEMAPLSGIDESLSSLKTADTWTLATFIAAIRELRAVCDQAGQPPRLNQLDAWQASLEKHLNQNVDAHGVLQSFAGGGKPHWGSLVFDLLPDHHAYESTLQRMGDAVDPILRTANYHAVTRYPERAFPWTTLWAAQLRARHGQSQCLDLIRDAARFCNSLGALPERVFYHGEPYNHWMMAAHASFLWAVHTGLAFCPDADSLQLFQGMQLSDQPAIHFDRVDAGHGLTVSATCHQAKLHHLTIINRGNPRPVHLFMPRVGKLKTTPLATGPNDLCRDSHWLQPT